MKFVSNGNQDSPQPPDYDGVFWLLNGTNIGSGLYNRIGKKITMKSIQVKFWLYPRQPNATPRTDPVPFEYIQLALIYDKNPGSASGSGAFPRS